jgi:predicted site-specific integrase-resolvase
MMNGAALLCAACGRPERWMTPEEVCETFQIRGNTLYRWNSMGTSPVFSKMGRHNRYAPADVKSWTEARKPDWIAFV